MPPGLDTVTSTTPLPAGATAVIDLALLMAKDAALVAPNFTAVAPVKSMPVIVTAVPPAAGPLFGEIEITEGAGTCAKALRLVPATDATSTATVKAIARIVPINFRIVPVCPHP